MQCYDIHWGLSLFTIYTFCTQPWNDSMMPTDRDTSSKLRCPPTNRSRLRVSWVKPPFATPCTAIWLSTCSQPSRPVRAKRTVCHLSNVTVCLLLQVQRHDSTKRFDTTMHLFECTLQIGRQIQFCLNSIKQQSAADFYAGGVNKTNMHAMVENTVKTR